MHIGSEHPYIVEKVADIQNELAKVWQTGALPQTCIKISKRKLYYIYNISVMVK